MFIHIYEYVNECIHFFINLDHMIKTIINDLISVLYFI